MFGKKRTAQPKIPRERPTTQAPPTPTPTHDEIALRAYEIYQQNGSQPNRCARNWRQAERELRRMARFRATQETSSNGSGDKHAELFNGKRPAADAKLLSDIEAAPVRMMDDAFAAQARVTPDIRVRAAPSGTAVRRHSADRKGM